ncbi:hypothetical protein J6590_097640, partial [Homalodisca vitripennis]
MPRYTKLCRKRCFRSNQHRKVQPQDIENILGDSVTDCESDKPRPIPDQCDNLPKITPQSASRTKIFDASVGYEENVKCVYGLRSIGKGSVAGRTLFAMLDLPTPPAR